MKVELKYYAGYSDSDDELMPRAFHVQQDDDEDTDLPPTTGEEYLRAVRYEEVKH